jgi:hypothetical protein
MLLKLYDYYYDDSDLGFHFHFSEDVEVLKKLSFLVLKTVESNAEYGKYLKDKDKYRKFKFWNVFTSRLQMSMKGLSRKYPKAYYVFFVFGFEIGYNPGATETLEEDKIDEYDKYNFNFFIIQSGEI